MKRGEVYWGNFDPTVGSEINKKRPCLIISNNITNHLSPLVTVLPLTTQKLDKVYRHEVLVINEPLLKNGKIKVNQIRTFDKQRIGKFIAELSDPLMAEVDKALLLHLSIKIPK
jgi:mRNA interferase MazF